MNIVRDCLQILWSLYRLWFGPMLGATFLGLCSFWLMLPASMPWSVAGLLLPHMLPLSVVCHECGHMAAARALGRKHSDVRVVVRGMGAYVDIPSGRGDRVIAAAGPGFPLVVGGLLLVSGLTTAGFLAPLSLPFLAHFVSVLPGTGDGKQIWSFRNSAMVGRHSVEGG